MRIWKELISSTRPIFILAPMDDVTDTAFRQLVVEIGAPDLFFTEFASVDGLQSPGRSNVKQKLKFRENERPLIAQIWGMNPENYLTSAREIAEMGFDGIDINMGCPTPVVTRKGGCSAMINTPDLAAEIIAATKEGAGNLSVSVKTRIGFKKIATEEWCGFLLEQDIAALTVHGRTAKELSKVPCHWDEISKVSQLRTDMKLETFIIGNGDVLSRQQGLELAKEHNLDGIMIGRGIFKDPFLFVNDKTNDNAERRFQLFSKHIDNFEQAWGSDKNPATLKKFAKMYINGFEGASEARNQLMQTNTLTELKDCVRSISIQHS
ncbi:tRNA-dihydrouridine synthase [Candidatus Saccharibacteria bacterium]|jgi:tRNA-dihydrouridine synthase|nr:tRNA-dihydrouridine synthase [Candidatus Saccharibacteria bacterium]